ncbi:SSI family serine proteinase inhibitor [Actinomadura violacea]|uniref:Subtilisin inhibitor domain-containing protein n=1 Tax=Actinomadura violacea TaxID=2819934 RepID=A0ABS3S2V2_9ACTN|nr:SSI family serine proteinase inhibitor [Actinomadura violacea]MBO2463324.1 hypothetical protein [Actinomadura violacea]
MRKAFGSVAVAFGAVAAFAVPANAAITSHLTVSMVAVSDGYTESVTLDCEPTGGTHPDAEAACKDLINANGDFRRIPPEFAACPTYYLPVTASVKGTWHGVPVSTSARYTNGACAKVETGGHVFNF